jgi:hypothetical protein
MDKNTEFGNRIKEIEELKLKYKLKGIDVLTLQLLAIIENSEFTYETYKKLLEDRNKII